MAQSVAFQRESVNSGRNSRRSRAASGQARPAGAHGSSHAPGRSGPNSALSGKIGKIRKIGDFRFVVRGLQSVPFFLSVLSAIFPRQIPGPLYCLRLDDALGTNSGREANLNRSVP
jgi:hypothetical protein